MFWYVECRSRLRVYAVLGRARLRSEPDLDLAIGAAGAGKLVARATNPAVGE
ncbi:MAG: hypothetical protein OES26_26340 [Gammaproteobacteria bacterium]|nr:hypothetical protein [Gammaproteobacteria bacterium]